MIDRSHTGAREQLAFPARHFALYIRTFKVIVVRIGVRACVCACVGERFSETDWELIGVEACDMDSLGEHM